jgi:hypothetical protein
MNPVENFNTCLREVNNSRANPDSKHLYVTIDNAGKMSVTNDKYLASSMKTIISTVHQLSLNNITGPRREWRELENHFANLIKQHQSKERSFFGKIAFFFWSLFNPNVQKMAEETLSNIEKNLDVYGTKLKQHTPYDAKKQKKGDLEFIENATIVYQTYGEILAQRRHEIAKKTDQLDLLLKSEFLITPDDFLKAFDIELAKIFKPTWAHENAAMDHVIYLSKKVVNEIVSTFEDFDEMDIPLDDLTDLFFDRLHHVIVSENTETLQLDPSTFKDLMGAKVDGKGSKIPNSLDYQKFKGLVKEYNEGTWTEGEREVTYDLIQENDLKRMLSAIETFKSNTAFKETLQNLVLASRMRMN